MRKVIIIKMAQKVMPLKTTLWRKCKCTCQILIQNYWNEFSLKNLKILLTRLCGHSCMIWTLCYWRSST